MKKVKGYYFSAVVFGVLSSLLWVYFAILMEDVINRVLNHEFTSFFYVLLSFVMYIVAVRVMSWIAQMSKTMYVNKGVEVLRNDYIRSKFDQRRIQGSSEILNSLMNDITIIKDNYFGNSVNIITELVTFLFSSYLMMKISITITLILYVLTGVLCVIPFVFKHTLQKNQESVSLNNEIFVNKVKDDFTGFNLLRDFNVTHIFKDKLEVLNHNAVQSTIKVEMVNSIFGEISHFFITIIGCLGFLVGSYYVVMERINYGEMIAIVQLTNTLVSPVSSVMGDFSRWISSKKLLDKIKSEITSSEGRVICDTHAIGPVKRIELKDISLVLSDKQILNHINLIFEENKKYLVLGETGCGKSTLLRLIMKYYTDYSGQLLFNGKDASVTDVPELSSSISYVEQNQHLLEDSIINNISLYKFMNDNDLQRVLTLTKLDELLASLDKGIHTVINEKQDNISGGEKDRIGICRALINNKQVYLFDEITASLDKNTMDIIDDIILRLDGMVINVAHKVDEIFMKQYDEIIQLSQGEVIFVGGFEEYECFKVTVK
ncbi:MAG: ABC transporter ATP-binding protein [Erysipelotrichaceae bacterium]|nr:ABC transporter ATP-binding protein [Erysipelotrichaceae bacterium]